MRGTRFRWIAIIAGVPMLVLVLIMHTDNSPFHLTSKHHSVIKHMLKDNWKSQANTLSNHLTSSSNHLTGASNHLTSSSNHVTGSSHHLTSSSKAGTQQQKTTHHLPSLVNNSQHHGNSSFPVAIKQAHVTKSSKTVIQNPIMSSLASRSFKGSSKATFESLPSISLTVRFHNIPKLLNLIFCDLLRSTALYWTRQLGNLTLILDKESLEDKQLAGRLSKHQQSMGINFNFVYEPLPKDPKIFNLNNGRTPGYNRQLYSSFLMDLFVTSTVIAWIDTDAKFITPVIPSNIIQNGRLLVKGMNTFELPWVPRWSKITETMTGKAMPADFMVYFPVYIWRDTITNCRNHIIKYMKVKSFDEAFGMASPRGLPSPVSIILTYAYYFEHHRYSWHIDILPQVSGRPVSLQDYNKQHLVPGHELTDKHTTMDLHVTLHTKYYIDSANMVNKQAYCTAINSTRIVQSAEIKTLCQPFQGKVMWPMFEFCNKPVQSNFKTWCKNDNSKCVTFLNDHYSNIRQAVNEGIYDLDLSKVKAVEAAAMEEKVTCRPYLK